MSKRQIPTMVFEEEDQFFEKDMFEKDMFFFDTDSVSSYCSNEGNEDDEILGRLEQRHKEEQRQKDQEQIKNFPVDIRVYNWQTPAITNFVNNEDFPGLLECLPKTPKKSKKGVGFTNTVPAVVIGRTGISVKKVMCSYFLQGRCTRSNCVYYHPLNEKCKFYTTCTNPKCVFVHPTSENPSVKPTGSTKGLAPAGSPPKVKLPNNEKCKHRICLNTFQIVDKKVVPTQKKCKHGDNCNFAHTIKEIATAIQSNQEKFKCKFGHKCKHVILETSKSVISDKQTKIYKYENKTEFCECPRVHNKESIQDFIVRVHTSRRPPQKIIPKNNA
jgi:hypothetical protein